MSAYHDPKRYSWPLSLFVPAPLVPAPTAWRQTLQRCRLRAPPSITDLPFSLTGLGLAEDRSNPPLPATPGLAASKPMPLHWQRHCGQHAP